MTSAAATQLSNFTRAEHAMMGYLWGAGWIGKPDVSEDEFATEEERAAWESQFDGRKLVSFHLDRDSNLFVVHLYPTGPSGPRLSASFDFAAGVGATVRSAVNCFEEAGILRE